MEENESGDWRVVPDHKGGQYYWNLKTNETQWDVPPGEESWSGDATEAKAAEAAAEVQAAQAQAEAVEARVRPQELPREEQTVAGAAEPAMSEAGDETDEDDLGRLQWIAYHLSLGEFAQAEELGWDGSPEDASAVSKASAALAAKTGAPRLLRTSTPVPQHPSTHAPATDHALTRTRTHALLALQRRSLKRRRRACSG